MTNLSERLDKQIIRLQEMALPEMAMSIKRQVAAVINRDVDKRELQKVIGSPDRIDYKDILVLQYTGNSKRANSIDDALFMYKGGPQYRVFKKASRKDGTEEWHISPVK